MKCEYTVLAYLGKRLATLDRLELPQWEFALLVLSHVALPGACAFG